MPKNIQKTRNRPGMRRQRQEHLVLIRGKDILHQITKSLVPRGIRFPELGIIHLVVLSEAFLDDVGGVFGRYGCFAGPAVAGVLADGFAEELSSTNQYSAEGSK